MFNVETLISDPYNRKARFQPALLTILPVIVASELLPPEIQPSWGHVIGFLAYCGGAMWLTQLVRDRGKALEPTLFEAWDGKPSVAMLRHRDSRLAKAIKERYRAFLNHQVPNLKLASPEEEERLPADADDGYESAIAWLLAQTRDREQFRLILDENITYGFRRNMLALKPIALLVDGLLMVAFLTTVAKLSTDTVGLTLPLIDKMAWAALLLTMLHALAFLFIVRRDWVRTAANDYARQLLSACDVFCTSNLFSSARPETEHAAR